MKIHLDACNTLQCLPNALINVWLLYNRVHCGIFIKYSVHTVSLAVSQFTAAWKRRHFLAMCLFSSSIPYVYAFFLLSNISQALMLIPYTVAHKHDALCQEGIICTSGFSMLSGLPHSSAFRSGQVVLLVY